MQSFAAGEDYPSETENAVTALVEARVRGALWVSPHVFLAAQAGIGMLETATSTSALSMGVASHDYGAVH